MKSLEDALLQLKNKNRRFSAVRDFILHMLDKSKKPLSVLDLRKQLNKKKLSANKTTIYRELEFLRNQKMIEEFNFVDGIKRYEIISGHHHHIVCVKCKKIEDVVLKKDLQEQEKFIAKNKKFKIFKHSLEFYGLCKNCLAKGMQI